VTGTEVSAPEVVLLVGLFRWRLVAALVASVFGVASAVGRCARSRSASAEKRCLGSLEGRTDPAGLQSSPYR
jgi:hypothetical protein